MTRLGRNGPEVSCVGLGCLGMAGGYGPSDDNESVATVHAALDAGINFIDAADFYGAGHTELLLREALKGGRRQRAFIAIKYGAMRGPDGKGLGDDARPSATKNYLAYTLKRLNTDYVDLYQPSRVDPAVPIEDTVGAIADMVKAGYVRHIGLSEASARTLRRAQAVHPIAALQIEYSLFTRVIENDILPAARELGVAHCRLWRARGRPDQRPRAIVAGRRRNPRPQAALLPGEFSTQSRHRAEACGDRQGEGLHHRSARHRLGALARIATSSR